MKTDALTCIAFTKHRRRRERYGIAQLGKLHQGRLGTSDEWRVVVPPGNSWILNATSAPFLEGIQARSTTRKYSAFSNEGTRVLRCPSSSRLPLIPYYMSALIIVVDAGREG